MYLSHMKLNSRKVYFAFLLIAITMLMTACKTGRLIVYNFADIKVHKIFHSRPLTGNTTHFTFHSTESGKFPKTVNDKPFETYLIENNTVAFLIIKNDTIQYEKYFKGYDKQSIVPSFSIAKSVTSMLIGCALDDGLIKSVNEPITEYIPELQKTDSIM
jgi:CubicO group peptidase (beta-lactamase class C family)